MSAFPESGRSDQQKVGESRVRFRPDAAVAEHRLAVDNNNRLAGERTHIVRLSDIVTRLQHRTAPCQHDFNI